MNIKYPQTCWIKSVVRIPKFIDETVSHLSIASSAAKVEFLENYDDHMKLIFKCACIILKEIQNSANYYFNDSLKTGSNVLRNNQKLSHLLKWILIGTDNKSGESDNKSKCQVDNSVNVIAQTILYEYKSKSQIKYANKSNELVLFRHPKEYPLQIAVGLYLHQQYRSKKIVKFFNSLGMSVEYNRLLRLENEIGNSVLQSSTNSNFFIPQNLIANKFIFFAVDNLDFNEDTSDGKNTLHATAMVVYQSKWQDDHVFTSNFKQCSSKLKILVDFNELCYCHVLAQC